MPGGKGEYRFGAGAGDDMAGGRGLPAWQCLEGSTGTLSVARQYVQSPPPWTKKPGGNGGAMPGYSHIRKMAIRAVGRGKAAENEAPEWPRAGPADRERWDAA